MLDQWFSTRVPLVCLDVPLEILLNIENRVLFRDIYFLKMKQHNNI